MDFTDYQKAYRECSGPDTAVPSLPAFYLRQVLALFPREQVHVVTHDNLAGGGSAGLMRGLAAWTGFRLNEGLLEAVGSLEHADVVDEI